MKFVDLAAQFTTLETEIRAAIDAVLGHGQFIMGPEVHALEQELAEYCGAAHVVSAASGTDALLMALMAYRVGRGDAVIVPAFTFVATAEVVQLLGATPIFADVRADTFNLDPDHLADTAAHIRRQGKLNLRGVIPVDLFGLSADYPAIAAIAAEYEMFVLSDCAQSFGGAVVGAGDVAGGAVAGTKKSGTFGDIAATSFFPAKPLGGYGDGGALMTDDATLADLARSVRIHGMGDHAYHHIRTGITGRLDTIQAAILRCKLKVLDQEIAQRQRLADTYTRQLAHLVTTPTTPAGHQSAWAQYTIRTPNRDQLRADLAAQNIPTATYYPLPLHQQPAYATPTPKQLPIAELLASEVLSLPIHPYLKEPDQQKIIASINTSLANR